MMEAMAQFEATMRSIDPDIFAYRVPDDPGPPIAEADIDRMCSAYFKYHEYIARRYPDLAPEDLVSVSDQIMDMAQENPERLWPLLVQLVERAPTDEIRGFVAAGPLEDVVRWYPERFVDRLEAQSISSENFHAAMRGVWGWEELPDVVRERLLPVVKSEWDELAPLREAAK